MQATTEVSTNAIAPVAPTTTTAENTSTLMKKIVEWNTLWGLAVFITFVCTVIYTSRYIAGSTSIRKLGPGAVVVPVQYDEGFPKVKADGVSYIHKGTYVIGGETHPIDDTFLLSGKICLGCHPPTAPGTPPRYQPISCGHSPKAVHSAQISMIVSIIFLFIFGMLFMTPRFIKPTET